MTTTPLSSSPSSPPPTGKQEELLIADDDPIARSILLNILKHKYSVTMVEDGAQAWEAITARIEQGGPGFDLIILDKEMPGINGFDLLEKIVKSNLHLTCPVLLISAAENSAGESADAAFALGSEDYLVKPLVKNVLLRRVQRALDRKHNLELARAYEAYRCEVEEKLKAMESLEAEVNETREKVAEATSALELPIIGISRTLSAILENEHLRDNPIKHQLEAVLKTMMSNNIYEPIFEKIRAKRLDPIAASFLHQYINRGAPPGHRRIRRQNSKSPATKLSVHEMGLAKWEFDDKSLSKSDEAKIDLMFSMFQYLLVGVDDLKINMHKFRSFMVEIQQLYKGNPYHNFDHAFDVTRTVFSLLVEFDAIENFSPLETFSLMCAAMCHDVGHPGVNNKYLMATWDDLAITYNNQSVLENYHCTLTFKTLQHFDFLEDATAETRMAMRQIIIGCILRTDMSGHFVMVGKLSQRNGVFDYENADDRQFVLELLLHAADISNVCKPFKVSEEWSVALTEEFFAQGDLEKSKGLTCDPFMDREKSSMETNTTNFIKFVCLEFFQSLALVFPKTILVFDQLKLNLQEWNERANQQK